MTDEQGDSGGAAESGQPGSADEPVEAVQAAREAVIKAMADTAELYGTKRSYGRLYGILYFADGPLSLDELVERSEYAKSTVSTAMRTLERFYLVDRRSLPGEGKRAFFEAERDWWYVTQQLLDQEGRREIATMTRALDDASERLDAVDTGRAQRDRERVEDLRETYDQAELFLDLFTELSPEELAPMVEAVTERPDGSDAEQR